MVVFESQVGFFEYCSRSSQTSSCKFRNNLGLTTNVVEPLVLYRLEARQAAVAADADERRDAGAREHSGRLFERFLVPPRKLP